MSLSIAIPSEANSVSPRPFVRVNKGCPVKSDAAGWYSMIYHRWSVDQIRYDIVYRLRDLNLDYDCAISDVVLCTRFCHVRFNEEFDETMEKEALEAESTIRIEFQNLIPSLNRGMIEEILEQFDALHLTKVQYKAAKIGLTLSDLMSVIDSNSMPSEYKSNTIPSTPKVN